MKLGVKGAIRDDSNTAGVFGTAKGCWMTSQPSGSYTGDFTVEAWVKPYTTTKAIQTFVDTRAAGPNGEYGFNIALLGSENTLGQGIGNNVGDGQNWMTNGNMRFAFTANRWYYIAETVSWAQRVAVIFLDGNFVGAFGLQNFGNPPLLFDQNHPFVIGGNPSQDTQFNAEGFDGAIDEVAVYETALTPSMIKLHYEAGRAP